MTFNASARRVENFRILIGTLIPPPFRQRTLGSSSGGPQTLLKVKSMHKFCFPCFSEGLHNINYLRQINIFPVYFGWISFPGLLNPLQTPSLTKLSKHLQATGKQPVHVEGDLIVRARLQFGRHGLSRLFSLKP